MSDNEVNEALEMMGFGDEPPKMLVELIRKFRSFKGKGFNAPLANSDIATCALLYELVKPKAAKKEEK